MDAETKINASKKAIIIEHGPNPSSDYFFNTFVEEKYDQILRVNFQDSRETYFENFTNADLIIVRYVSLQWIKQIRRNREKIGKIIFFFDDDLLDPRSWIFLPISYGIRLTLNYLKLYIFLFPIVDEYRVGSEALQKKYYYLNPALILPSDVTPNHTNQQFIIFYHGTSSHVAEKRWLHPIIREIMSTEADVTFEIIGDGRTKKLFADIPRVTVIHPMDWTNYQSFCLRYKRHIGLAPLLDTRFNRYRSETKIFDIRRCSAIGIFSDVEPYRTRLRRYSDVNLIENDPIVWVDTIKSILKILRSSRIRSND